MLYIFLRRDINLFMPNGLLYHNSLNRSIPYIRDVWLVFIIIMFVEFSELNTNGVDPDQTSHSVASDLGLHYLTMSFLWDARHKWVKVAFVLLLEVVYSKRKEFLHWVSYRKIGGNVFI